MAPRSETVDSRLVRKYEQAVENFSNLDMPTLRGPDSYRIASRRRQSGAAKALLANKQVQQFFERSRVDVAGIVDQPASVAIVHSTIHDYGAGFNGMLVRESAQGIYDTRHARHHHWSDLLECPLYYQNVPRRFRCHRPDIGILRIAHGSMTASRCALRAATAARTRSETGCNAAAMCRPEHVTLASSAMPRGVAVPLAQGPTGNPALGSALMAGPQISGTVKRRARICGLNYRSSMR